MGIPPLDIEARAADAERRRSLRRIWSHVPILLIGIVALGLFLRLYDLERKSLWIDEIKSLQHAQAIMDVNSFLAPQAGNAHPPLYFLLLKLWLFFGNGEFHSRLMSSLFGTAVVPLTYLLGRRFLDQRASLIAALLASISPLLLLHDREVRMYPLLVFFSIGSVYSFATVVKENGLRHWFLFTVFSVLMVYTHYHGFLVLAACWIYLLLRSKARRDLWKGFVLSNCALALSYAAWLPAFFYHLRRFSELVPPDIFPSLFGQWVTPLYLFFALSLGQTVLPWKFWIVFPSAVLFAYFFFSGFLGTWKTMEGRDFFLVFLFVPMLLAFMKESFMPRYLVFLAPIYYLIIAKGLANIGHRHIRAAAVVVLSGLIAVPVMNYFNDREFHILSHVDPLKEVGSYLKANVGKDDVVLNLGGGVGRVIGHYWGGEAEDLCGVGDSVSTPADGVTIWNFDDGRSAGRVWAVVAFPALKRCSERWIKWLDGNYERQFEKRFGKDPDYEGKVKFFKKDFYEYRVTVYAYKLARDSTIPPA
jgi:hypothetical protein